MTDMPLTRRDNIDSLTGFRFVAAMMVFFSHFAIPGVTGIPLQMTLSGYAGVTLFFVLSGFVIAYTYLEQFEAGMTGRNVGAYLAARFARVYPLYLLFILFGWLTTNYSGTPWRHLLAVQTWSSRLEVAYGINGPAWSVGVEVFLYLAFPLVLPCWSGWGTLFRAQTGWCRGTGVPGHACRRLLLRAEWAK
jgi:peptidoglycan/LPS O-acetylase OafA/YrhL